MSLTEEQKVFHSRKMKTRFAQMDINGDGYISVEDYRELEKRFIEYGRLTGEAEQRLRKQMQVLVSCSVYFHTCNHNEVFTGTHTVAIVALSI